MVAIPAIPPDDNWFGNKKRDTAIAIINEPIIVPINSMTNFFTFINKITFIALFAYTGDFMQS